MASFACYIRACRGPHWRTRYRRNTYSNCLDARAPNGDQEHWLTATRTQNAAQVRWHSMLHGYKGVAKGRSCRAEVQQCCAPTAKMRAWLTTALRGPSDYLAARAP